MKPDGPPPPPQRELPDPSWEHAALYKSVREAIATLPVYFRTETHMGDDLSSLHVGDRIRILAVPGKDVAGYWLHEDTRVLYERLVTERIVLEIYEIDEWGRPWVRCRSGNSACDEYLAIDEYDAWELVTEIA